MPMAYFQTYFLFHQLASELLLCHVPVGPFQPPHGNPLLQAYVQPVGALQLLLKSLLPGAHRPYLLSCAKYAPLAGPCQIADKDTNISLLHASYKC